MKRHLNGGRFTATMEEDFVVFLIGSRLNRLRDAPKMIRIARQMRAMQKELQEAPDLGLLHMEDFFGRVTVSVQYWRDFESLENYAKSNHQSHLPAWREYNRLIRDSGTIGVWHETYRVRASDHESVYVNMPTFGLANAGAPSRLASSSTARRRMEVVRTTSGTGR